MVPEISPRNRRRLVWAGVLAVVVLIAWWMTLSEKTTVSSLEAPPIDALIMPGETHSQSLEAVAATLHELTRRLTSLERGAAAQRDERRLELEQLHRALMAEVQGADAARRTAAAQELARLREEMVALGYAPPPGVTTSAIAAGETAAAAAPIEPAPPAAALSLPSGASDGPDARAPAEAAPAPNPAIAAPRSARRAVAGPDPAERLLTGDELQAVFERRGGPAAPAAFAPGVGDPGLAEGPGAGVRLLSVAASDGPRRSAVGGSQVFLPSGSILSGVLLTGLDAPGGSAAKANPVPVLLRLKHEAILPNRFGADVRECFALLSAFGELSSERASMRGEQISCILVDGTVMQRPLKAYGVGEDGKVGVRGRVVTSQGAFIARAILVGVLDGVAQAFNDGVQVSVGTSDSLGGAVAGGFGAGFGSAFDRIADWYLQQADALFPVIEIDVGRSVDVVLTEGLEFRLDLGGAR